MIDLVCAIGHVSKDIIRINGGSKELPGGTGFYFPLALKSLGFNVSLITKLCYQEKYLLDDLYSHNIPVFLGVSETTTAFENRYDNDPDFRVQKVTSIASPFTRDDIPDISPTLFHVGPLTKGDIPLEVLKFLSENSRVSLDVQGFVRNVREGQVEIRDWDDKGKGLSYVEVLKAHVTEAVILSGEKDMERAAKKLSEFGPREVIITLGSKGSLIYSRGKFHMIPAFPERRVTDPTGCGDTYMAGYLYMRLKGYPVIESGRFSAAISSLKLENYGPFKGSEDDVKQFLMRRRSHRKHS